METTIKITRRATRWGRKIGPVVVAVLTTSLLVPIGAVAQGDSTLGGTQDQRAGATWHAARAMQQEGRRSVLADSYRTPSGTDITASSIREYLESHGSPMAPHAETIVVAANLHRVDPRLVVAIAGVESSYGKHSWGHNAWGWNNGYTKWGSWEEAILEYTEKLATLYPNREDISQMAWRYNPVTPVEWGNKVSYLVSTMVEG